MSVRPLSGIDASRTNGETSLSGMLILNADDWGRDRANTDRILDCVTRGTVSSASAMVFMEDSERAGELARQKGIDAGLHLNLTTPFSATTVPSRLKKNHQRILRYLGSNHFFQVLYHPGLAEAFKYVVASQFDEFQRVYGEVPARVDGHHHMHLCANVLLGKLLPSGTIARRNFSFQSGEKGAVNRLYRKAVDNKLAKRHCLTDYFFSLAPLEPRERLERIISLALRSVVEVETHPVNEEEYRFLMGDGVTRWANGTPIAPGFFKQTSRATRN